MLGVSLRTKGDFSKTKSFLEKLKKRYYLRVLNQLAEKGVAALSEATPKDTGHTSECWEYRIEEEDGQTSIIWYNTSMTSDGRSSIAVLLQYGHGTGTGGYVQGRDYINPAMRPIFDSIADTAWKVISES